MRLLAPVMLLLTLAAGCGPSPATPLPTGGAIIATAAPTTSPGPTTSPAPTTTPDPEVLCRAEGNRLEVSCTQLAQLAIAAVAGLPQPVAAIGMSAYGFPCGTPIPVTAPAESCQQDVDEGPVAWVALEGTQTIAALHFAEGADDVASAMLVAFGTTPLSIEELLEAADPQPSFSPLPSQPAEVGRPVLVLADGTQHPVSMRGGCGSVAFGGDYVAADQCGPTLFDPAIEATAIRVRAGETIVLSATDGWQLGADARLGVPWIVRIASTDGLAGREEDHFSFPDGSGRVVKDGTMAYDRIRVTVPRQSGDYLLQFAGAVSRDGWSYTEGTFYWHLRIPEA